MKRRDVIDLHSLDQYTNQQYRRAQAKKRVKEGMISPLTKSIISIATLIVAILTLAATIILN